MTRATLEAARVFWPGTSPEGLPYYNYRLEHVEQVERDALRLLAEIEADREILLAAIWIHDRFQPQYAGDAHAARAAEWAATNLAPLGFPEHKVQQVCCAVANHSNPPRTIPEQAVEARLLWDADKLSKIGALSVVGFLCAAPAFPQNRIAFVELARNGGDHGFDEQAWIASFYSEPARRWAERRWRAQRDFFAALRQDVGL
jgi:hypothetical protein